MKLAISVSAPDDPGVLRLQWIYQTNAPKAALPTYRSDCNL